MHTHHRWHHWRVEPLPESVDNPAPLPGSYPRASYGVLERGKRKGDNLVLAASAQNKCSSLVCSCYVPTRQHNTNNSHNHHHNNKNGNNTSNCGLPKMPTSNFNQEVDDKNHRCSNSQKKANELLAPPLKSNLKKTSIVEEPQLKNARRKVSWPDAHGKDLAQVQEFDSGVLEDGDFGGVRNSCVCVIQ